MNDKLRENYINLKIRNKNLYLSILVDKYNKEDLLDKIAASISAGIDIIELSTNDYPNKLLEISTHVKQFYSIFDFTFIIKDRADIAFIVGADGISLTPNSIDISSARQILGDDFIIGCYEIPQKNCDFCICNKEPKENKDNSFVKYYDTNNSDKIFLDEFIFANPNFIEFITKLRNKLN